jgi:nucleotide-binding universal stress UspA family protein
MHNHVLVPLDGSGLAEEALQPAKQLVRPNGKFTLVSAVNVLQPWDYSFYRPVVPEDYRNLADPVLLNTKAYLEQVTKALLEEDYQVDTVAEFGDAATIILETAISRKVDVIVMSTHGRSGFSRWLLGSVTGKVLSAAPCPVYVIPDKRRMSEIETTATAEAASSQ